MEMRQDQPDHGTPSFMDPIYVEGIFIEKSQGWKDAEYKVEHLKALLKMNPSFLPAAVNIVADVGCGSGRTTFLLHEMLVDLGFTAVSLHGYDIHPKVSEFRSNEKVQFIAADFCVAANEIYDLVILFDVIEHVPDPINFIRGVARSTHLLAFHIPLEDSLFSWLRGLTRINLSYPGHLINLDAASALNLLSFAGVRVIDFTYSPVFRAPSGTATRSQRLLNPLRKLLFSLSPYMTQKLLSGVSMMVIAKTSLSSST